MTSWNERTRSKWHERIIRVLILLAVLALTVAVCTRAFAALMPGESIRYSYLDHIGRVEFVRDSGGAWLVGWFDGQGDGMYYLLGADEALVETIARPRIARTGGSGLLYVSSIMQKEVVYQVFLPRVRKP